MNITVKTGKLEKQKTGCLILGAAEGKLNSTTLKRLEPELAATLKKAASREKFSGKSGQMLELTAPAGCRAERLLLIGLGEEKKATGETLRLAVGTALQRLQKVHEHDLMIAVDTFTLRKADAAQRAECLESRLSDWELDRRDLRKRHGCPFCRRTKSESSRSVSTLIIPLWRKAAL